MRQSFIFSLHFSHKNAKKVYYHYNQIVFHNIWFANIFSCQSELEPYELYLSYGLLNVMQIHKLFYAYRKLCLTLVRFLPCIIYFLCNKNCNKYLLKSRVTKECILSVYYIFLKYYVLTLHFPGCHFVIL